jgi:hypothetical protein
MMGNSEQPSSGARKDWPVLLGGMVGGVIGGALALLSRTFLPDLGLLWGTIAFCAVFGVGIILGRLVGSLLFPKPPGT